MSQRQYGRSRAHQVVVRVSEEERQQIHDAAFANGQSVSDYARERLLGRPPSYDGLDRQLSGLSEAIETFRREVGGERS